MDEQPKFEAKRFRWLRKSGMTLRLWLAKAILWVAAVYRLKSSFMGMLLLCASCALFAGACTHDDDSSADRAERHQHRRGGYGQGERGDSDRSYRSSTPIPGL